MSVGAAADPGVRAPGPGLGTVGRLAGAGGLVFAASIAVQNVLRAKAPGFDAAPAQVTAYFLGHRPAVLIPLGLFPVAMIPLFMFAAALRTGPDREADRWWAAVGTLGTAAITALFAIVNITEIVLAAKAAQLASSPAVIQALWTLHAAAFGLDLAAIATALIGLSQAAASIRLIPAWLAVIAWPGAACLLIAAVFTVALASGGPWLMVALPGFAVWFAFVVVASVALLRRRPPGVY
jgi:hypothetical protein